MRRLQEESRAASIGTLPSEPDAEDSHTSVVSRSEEAASAALVTASGTPRSTFIVWLEDVVPTPSDVPEADPEPRVSTLQRARMCERRSQENEARKAE